MLADYSSEEVRWLSEQLLWKERTFDLSNQVDIKEFAMNATYSHLALLGWFVSSCEPIKNKVIAIAPVLSFGIQDLGSFDVGELRDRTTLKLLDLEVEYRDAIDSRSSLGLLLSGFAVFLSVIARGLFSSNGIFSHRDGTKVTYFDVRNKRTI